VRAVPRLCELYHGICLTTEEKHGKTSVRVAARTSQADTVQYKNNEQYKTQKKNSNKKYNAENFLFWMELEKSGSASDRGYHRDCFS
jgi:hypothetical protein